VFFFVLFFQEQKDHFHIQHESFYFQPLKSLRSIYDIAPDLVWNILQGAAIIFRCQLSIIRPDLSIIFTFCWTITVGKTEIDSKHATNK
jgi:hypothetical protein